MDGVPIYGTQAVRGVAIAFLPKKRTICRGEFAMTDSFIFRVRNHHVENCGAPPCIDDPRGDVAFRSYFENELGEQWIFLYDKRRTEWRSTAVIVVGKMISPLHLKDSLRDLPG